MEAFINSVWSMPENEFEVFIMIILILVVIYKKVL